MSHQTTNDLDQRPVWLKRCLVVFIAIFLFRVISFWLELLFGHLQGSISSFISYIISYDAIILPVVSVGIAVLIGFWLEKWLLNRKKATNVVFLVLFVLLALNPAHFVIGPQIPMMDEFHEYMENAGTVLPVSIDLRPVLSEPDGSIPYTLKDTQESLYLSDQVVIDETYFIGIRVEPAITDKRFDIYLAVNEIGAEKMLAYTKNHMDERLAIVIDGELVKAITILSALRDHLCFNDFSKEQAFDVAARLKSMIDE